MKTFPLINRMGLSISDTLVYTYDMSERKLVYTVDAEDLETLLAKASLVYYHKVEGVPVIKTEKTHMSTHVGMFLEGNEIPKPCVICEPAFHDEVTECKHCGRELRRKYE